MHNPRPPVKVSERVGDPIFTPYLVSKFPVHPDIHQKNTYGTRHDRKAVLQGKGKLRTTEPTAPYVIIIIIVGNRVCFKHFRGVFASYRLTMYNYAKASI